MKISIDYKKGSYAKKRKLKICDDKNSVLTEIRQGETEEIELTANTEFIYGKMDWGKTEKFKVHNLDKLTCIEIVPSFSPNPLKAMGLSSL